MQIYHFSWWRNPFYRWREGQLRKVQRLFSYGLSIEIDEFEKQTVIPAFNTDLKSFIDSWKEITEILGDVFFKECARYGDDRLKGYSDFLSDLQKIKHEYVSIKDYHALSNYLGKITEKAGAAQIEINIILEIITSIKSAVEPPSIVYKLLQKIKNLEALLLRIRKNCDTWINSRLYHVNKTFEIVQQNLKNSYFKMMIAVEILAIIMGILFGSLISGKNLPSWDTFPWKTNNQNR